MNKDQYIYIDFILEVSSLVEKKQFFKNFPKYALIMFCFSIRTSWTRQPQK